MKFNKWMKRSVGLFLVLILVFSMTGCINKKSVEEQVSENLLWESIAEKEAQPVEIPESLNKEEVQPIEEIVEEEEIEVNLEILDEEAETEEEVLAPEVEEVDDNKLQIVFFGDSIFDNARDGTGVPYLTGELCDANIYNLAIGGTSAGLERDQPGDYDKWESIGLLGMVYAACGYMEPDYLNGFYARKVFDKVDFSKTDYFVLEYGTNDFLANIPISNDDSGSNDPYSYRGAINLAIHALSSEYPNAKIVFCTPHYEQFWAGDGRWLGDSNTFNRGYGTLYQYTAAGRNAAESCGATVLNGYSDLGLDAYTAEEYLEDGIHLTAPGRKKYAEVLAGIIMKMEGIEPEE